MLSFKNFHRYLETPYIMI